jgi:hypothetical protein
MQTHGLLAGLERPPVQPETDLKHLPSKDISRGSHQLLLARVGLAHQSPSVGHTSLRCFPIERGRRGDCWHTRPFTCHSQDILLCC